MMCLLCVAASERATARTHLCRRLKFMTRFGFSFLIFLNFIEVRILHFEATARMRWHFMAKICCTEKKRKFLIYFQIYFYFILMRSIKRRCTRNKIILLFTASEITTKQKPNKTHLFSVRWIVGGVAIRSSNQMYKTHNFYSFWQEIIKLD